MSNFPKRMYDGILNVINELKQRITNIESSAGESITNYSDLENKPSINNVVLDGNKTSSQLRLASSSHTHNEYALTTHTHSADELTAHTHSQSDVTGLTTALAGKASTSHTHSGYASTSHTHSEFDEMAIIPKGTIWWFALSTPPEGWAVYEPLIGRYALGATSGIGSIVAAGLPNISGTFRPFMTEDEPTGAFSKESSVADKTVQAGSGHLDIYTVGFDASVSNPIYGNSDTVTPPSVKLLPCIKL